MKDLQTVLDALESCTYSNHGAREPEFDDDKVAEAIAIVRGLMQAEPVGEVRNSSAYFYNGMHTDKTDVPDGTKLFAAPQAVPDPMTLMTDASIMQVAQGWREFDAPDGSGPVDSMVYGACRAALNKYRDLLLEAK